MVSKELKIISIVEVLNSNNFKFEDNNCYKLFFKLFNLLGKVNNNIFDRLYKNILLTSFKGLKPKFRYDEKEKILYIKDYDRELMINFDFLYNEIFIVKKVKRPLEETLYKLENNPMYKDLLLQEDIYYCCYSYDKPNELDIEINNYYESNIVFDEDGNIDRIYEKNYLSRKKEEKIDNLEIIWMYLNEKCLSLEKKIDRIIKDDIVFVDKKTYKEINQIKKYLKALKMCQEEIDTLKTSNSKENKVICSVTLEENNRVVKYFIQIDESKNKRVKN